MLIPHRQLSAEALQGLIEAFVTREGTDYGDVEVTLLEKVRQVQSQLNTGFAVIVFDSEDGSFTIPTSDQLSPAT
jgi:uncharacterized protein